MKIYFQINDISKRFGSKLLFEHVHLSIGAEHKIGVIGRNGAGKSTFLKMLMELEEPDEGKIVFSNDLMISYLEQHDSFLPTETIEEYLMRYTDRESWECGKIAGKFQLKNDLFDATPIGKLSGGYQTRVKLCAMLLKEPNFILFDEPTNFLDVQTQILLERFMKQFNGGYLVVSHDREFLKRTCSTTIDVSRQNIHFYQGNIDKYVAESSLQQDRMERENKNIAQKQKQLQTFIDKNKAKAFGSAQAKNKQKQLDRLELNTLDQAERTVKLKIPHIDTKKGRVFECEEMKIGYGEKVIAKEIGLDFNRGAHVAIIGENGQGKTTFLKSIAGELELIGGRMKWAHQVKVAYYAQHVYQTIEPMMTVYQYLENMAEPGTLRQDILNMAGSFLFSGDDVEKKVKVLSGGERARLCLAGVLLQKADVLILDEPNNHLDFETVESLGRSLAGYNGTLFFVSHDREFVRNVAKEIVCVEQGCVKKFLGSYDDYLYFIENEIYQEQEPEKIKTSAQVKVAAQKISFNEEKKLKNKQQKLEKELETEIKAKKRLEIDMMENPQLCSFDNKQKLESYEQKIGQIEEELLTIMDALEG